MSLQILTCDGCGACCAEQGSPPFLPHWIEGTDANRLKDEQPVLFNDYFDRITVEPDRYDRGLPCFWYDEATKRCIHYEHRPDVCREFEVGCDACHEWRKGVGLE